MNDSVELDSVDRKILDLLVQDGRRSILNIAEEVNLSPAPVKRRIDRLERAGVIAGYTAILDHSRLGDSIEAFTELRFAGDTNVESITGTVIDLPEVVEVFTVAGDPDALVRVRVAGVQHLKEVIDKMRRSGHIIGTKTLMILDSHRRGTRRHSPGTD
ncbi:AsnC family transcriptional regulator [Sinosporangium siamense]|uniref:AsnC family transcriptional regulator n=1 Tax=Sinosporangium siamense TaxID=1367973 RepID=A0A919RKD0_9ACTN|nr:AsnC family transcriptional regulator [Sinosporangium siamense]